VGGQARWREESFRAFNVEPQDDDHTQSRVAVNADLLLGRRTGAFGRVLFEGRDAQSYGRNLPGGAKTTVSTQSRIPSSAPPAVHAHVTPPMNSTSPAPGKRRRTGKSSPAERWYSRGSF
jgi:hypothetical protein